MAKYYSIQETGVEQEHAIYIFEDLAESDKYYELVAYLSNLKPNETVYIYFDSTGGDYHTSIVLSNAIRICHANVVGVIMCRCYSGASAVALACDRICVKSRGSMMVHNCRIWRDLDGIYINELCHWVKTEYETWRKFFDEVYVQSGFLTEDEGQSILDEGKELYFSQQDLKDRLRKIGLLCELSDNFEKAGVCPAGARCHKL